MFITSNLRWCTITYWEYNRPYHKQLHGLEKSVRISQNLLKNQNNSLCLQEIQKCTKNQEVLQTRSRIVDGTEIIVDQQRKIVLLSNLTNSMVYWTCPGLVNDLKRFKTNSIKPNETSIIYNYNMVQLNETIYRNMPGFHEPHIVNVSFSKNWGKTSNRNSIEQCPCWFNISLNQFFFK